MPSAGVESLIRARPKWLQRRVELFESYCLPSLRAQTERNFHWIIYFDTESPSWLRDRILAWQTLAPIQPFFRTAVSDAERVADIRAVVGQPADELLTTNIDNDDGLSIDFVERLANYRRRQERCALYFEFGLIKSEQRLYLQRDPDNAFCSVLETWDVPLTCWAAAHNELGRLIPQATIGGAPAWLQVIHDTNVSNRVQGRRVSAGAYLAQFTGLATLPEPSGPELAIDCWIDRPLRSARRLVRRTAKAAIIRLSGRQGGERVKYLVQFIRRRLRAMVQ
ncbi:hypothetical protein VE25_11405 [Devosia geojensis]|uniref:Rhamnosyl transferase n=2 Tax=Devosia geojensis TaxID=443610 RepID=A0A0F5FSI5_9HYPH|nr:hypothetical protein VE25_11405 [Devosia geojensis]